MCRNVEKKTRTNGEKNWNAFLVRSAKNVVRLCVCVCVHAESCIFFGFGNVSYMIPICCHFVGIVFGLNNIIDHWIGSTGYTIHCAFIINQK